MENSEKTPGKAHPMRKKFTYVAGARQNNSILLRFLEEGEKMKKRW